MESPRKNKTEENAKLGQTTSHREQSRTTEDT